MIIVPNGDKYTSAEEDMTLKTLKNAFRQALHREIMRAMRDSKDGKLYLNLPEIEIFLEQAYYLGKDHD
jgi:hypothetical protein